MGSYNNLVTDLIPGEGVDWEGTLRRLAVLREECGELCDTSKPVNQGEFLGSVTSKVRLREGFN